MSNPGTLAHVLAQPPGTRIRRKTWPPHQWVTVVAERRNGDPVLEYCNVLDLGSHPLNLNPQWMQTVTTASVPTSDAMATDWEIIDRDPVAIDDGAMPAMGVLGRVGLQPVARCPDLPGYRPMTVLVPVDMFNRHATPLKAPRVSPPTLDELRTLTPEQLDHYARTGCMPQ